MAISSAPLTSTATQAPLVGLRFRTTTRKSPESLTYQTCVKSFESLAHAHIALASLRDGGRWRGVRSCEGALRAAREGLFVAALNPAQYRVAQVVVVVDAKAQMAEELAGLVAVRADVNGLRRSAELREGLRRDYLDGVRLAVVAQAAIAHFVGNRSR